MVFELTAAVPEVIFEASDVEAARMAELVFALMLAARLDEAFRTFVFAVVILVLAAARVEPSEVEAFEMFVLAVFTFVPIVAKVAPSELDAFVTSDWTASEPELRLAPVSVLVPKLHTSAAVRLPPPPDTPLAKVFPIVPGLVSVEVAIFQTSAARAPKVVRDLEPDDQTLRGMVDARDVLAVRTVASV